MSNRYGRNQRRAHRQEIADLTTQVTRLERALINANDRAKPFDAQRYLLKDLSGRLGEEMLPYIEGMMRADEHEPVLTMGPARYDEITGQTTIQANIQIRRAVRFRP